MKKLIKITAICCFLFVGLAQAQTKKRTSKKSSNYTSKNNWEAGANLNLFFVNGGSSTGVNATIAKFFTNKTQFGLRVGTTFQTGANVIIAGVFGKYFIDNFYVGGGLEYSRTTFQEINAFFVVIQPEPYNQFTATLDGGYRFPIDKKFAIDTGASLLIPVSNRDGGVALGLHGGIIYKF